MARIIENYFHPFFKPFQANAPFLYPLKTYENQRFSDVSFFFFWGGGGGGKKGNIGPKPVDDKSLDSLHMFFKTKLQ